MYIACQPPGVLCRFSTDTTEKAVGDVLREKLLMADKEMQVSTPLFLFPTLFEYGTLFVVLVE